MSPAPHADDWEKASFDFKVGSFESIRNSCEKWGATIATLLGIFSTVAILAGPTQLSDLPSQTNRWIVVGLTVAAGIAAFVAILYAAFGAQGVDFKLWTPWNGEAYRAYVMKNAEVAARRLRRSRFCGITAAVLVSVAALYVLFVSTAYLGKDDTKASQVVVVTTSGELVFGELVKTPEGRVTVGDQEVPDAAQVVLLKAGN